MKRRVRKIANFFAFNLLFFALYLNFIHRDKPPAIFGNDPAAQQTKAPLSGTVLVDNPEQTPAKKQTGTTTPQTTEPKTEQGSTAALKLSVN